MSHQSNVSTAMRDILPSKHSSASDPSLPHPSRDRLPLSPSFTSLAHSDGDTLSLQASTVVQESDVDDLPAQSDIIIAVMGPTGAGKSTFINKAAGISETEVGHGLESCTHTVKIVRCFDEQQNRRVVFVDTPGFNDTNISDLDILRLIADWLKLTYKKDIRLSGLLFFHRISDNRMGGSPLKYLKMFQNLCGREALKNVVLVTTMWDEVNAEEGRNRETELTTKYWNSMLELGCHTSRFFNTTESAWDIVSQFQDARCTVLLQKELVDLRLELSETSAGRTLFSMLIEFIKKIKEYLAQLEAKLKLNQYPENRIVVEQKKTETEAILLDADAKRRQYSTASGFRRFSNSRPSTSVLNAKRPPISTTFPYPPAQDTGSNTGSPIVAMLRASFPLTSSPIAECLSPPPSPANGTGEAYGGTRVLQGTITALRLVHQIVGFAPIPGLQILVKLVLDVSEIVNNMYAAEEALINLAQKAGSFLVTLVDQELDSIVADSEAMKFAIEGLTKEMNRVLKVVKRISSQRTAKRLLLSALGIEKAAIDDCNHQMTFACGVFGIQIAFVTQQAIARIEDKLSKVLEISPRSNQIRRTTAQRATI